jgi:hypothetical protein
MARLLLGKLVDPERKSLAGSNCLRNRSGFVIPELSGPLEPTVGVLLLAKPREAPVVVSRRRLP